MAIAALAVTALHGLLIYTMFSHWPHTPTASTTPEAITPPVMQLALLPPPVQVQPISSPMTDARPAPLPTHPTKAPRRKPTPRTSATPSTSPKHAASPATPLSAPLPPTTTPTAASAQTSPHSASQAKPRFDLNHPSTQQSLQAIGQRSPSLAEQANTQLHGQHHTPNRRDQELSQGLAQAAKGDCAKGEFTGGNMGLLSAPFLAAAVLNGDCAR